MSYGNKIRIYLAGTIYDEEPHSSWKKNFMISFDDLDDHYEVFDPDPCNEADLTMVARDKKEIENCDIFVAYIAKYTAGTSMEIYHAFLTNNTPIIIISPNGVVCGDIWIEAHSHYICGSVEDAVDHIKSMKF